MKKIGLFALSLALLAVGQIALSQTTTTSTNTPAVTPTPTPKPKLQEFVFNCTNEYVQMVIITIDTYTLDQAWRIIKTDKDLRTKYSLDETAQCSFRAIGKLDKTKKHHPMLDKMMQQMPQATPTPSPADDTP